MRAFLPVFLGSVASLAAGCTSTATIAEPDIVAKLGTPVSVSLPCIAQNLGREFRDRYPTIDYVPGKAAITVNAPRGDILAFVTVEPGPGAGSTASFYNGDLYWPNRANSGMFPDLMRDNWHRAERAIRQCDLPADVKPGST